MGCVTQIEQIDNVNELQNIKVHNTTMIKKKNTKQRTEENQNQKP